LSLDSIYFVWIKTNGMPSCQIWHGNQINTATGKPRDEGVIRKIELNDKEKHLTLDELKFVYPLNKE
jgi:hypothetical protein